MSDITSYTQTQTWPFLLSSVHTQQELSVASSFYDMRLSFILPKKRFYTGAGQWFTVALVDTTGNTFTFLLQDTLNQLQDVITYKQGVWQDDLGFLDIANSYIDTAWNVPVQQQLNLIVCASCLLVTTAGAELTLYKGPVHRAAVDQSCVQSTKLQSLCFVDGHNTQLSYRDGTLSVSVLPGAGKPKPFSYKDWVQYAQVSVSDAQIAALRNGAKSINSITGAVKVMPGRSISITPSTSNKQLTLKLAVNKVQE